MNAPLAIGRAPMTRQIPSGSRIPILTRRNALILGASGLGAAALWNHPARAVLRVDVNEGNVQPVPIAVTDFIAGSPGDAETARGVSQSVHCTLAQLVTHNIVTTTPLKAMRRTQIINFLSVIAAWDCLAACKPLGRRKCSASRTQPRSS